MADPHNPNVSAPAAEMDRRMFLTAAAVTLPLVSSASAQSPTGAAQAPESNMVRLEKSTPQIWRVTVSNPPFNLVVPEMVSALHAVVLETERDPDVKVVLFTSELEGYFINHFDLAKAQDFPMEATNPPTSTWTDMVVRMTRSPVINIAVIRGRTRGGGNEFSLACDLRYASREKAFFGQPEVGAGILPGGGASERMPRLIGRDRALEVILSSQDYAGDEAERFGLVTRALPDGELDAFVEALSARLGGFDRQALAAAKAQINRATLPPERDLHAAYGVQRIACLARLQGAPPANGETRRGARGGHRASTGPFPWHRKRIELTTALLKRDHWAAVNMGR